MIQVLLYPPSTSDGCHDLRPLASCLLSLVVTKLGLIILLFQISSLTFLLCMSCASPVLLSHLPAFIWPAHQALCAQAVLVPITHTTLSHLLCLLKSALILAACRWFACCLRHISPLTWKSSTNSVIATANILPNSSHYCICSFLDAPRWPVSQPMADHCPLIFSIFN